ALPPLRDRPDDIVPLAEHFIARASERTGKPIAGLSGAAVKRLISYGWPGNVRELENAIERAVALCEGERIGPDDLPEAVKPGRPHDFLELAADRLMTLAEVERAYAKLVLRRVGGNKLRAASLLGVDRRTLQRWFADPGDEPSGT